jgi:hypothetical protein
MVAPTFLGIGAMKCGTTTVHQYLRLHPNVFVPKNKEINWSFSTSQADYEAIFPARFTVRGEISPQYNSRINLIAKLYPNIKIILCVRNPIDRFISALRHFRTKHRKFGDKSVKYLYDVDQIIGEGHRHFIMEQGFYQRTVLEVFDRFAPRPYGQRLHVINFDKLISKQQQVCDGLCRFLGAPTFTTKAIHAHSSNRESYEKVTISTKQRQALADFYRPSNEFMKQHYHVQAW